jgi:hypothetical protein
MLLFVAGIIFFCFFYVSIIFNPNEAADNMRKYGGFIPGIRPGRNTADYMNNILTKITVVGGIVLEILCLIPDIMISGIKLAASASAGRFYRCSFSEVHPGRFEREVLFRRNFAVDCRGRRDGYHQPDRSPVDHASLRGLHAACRPYPGRRSSLMSISCLTGLSLSVGWQA